MYYHGVEFDVRLEETSAMSCHIISIFDDSDLNKIEKITDKLKEVRELSKEDDSYSFEEFANILSKIDLSVLLIAHQRSSITVKRSSGKHHSLSESVDNAEEWIKAGFINALEYQNPRIQGMIKNNLKDIKTKFATITGSDCHVWNAYPNKDNNIQEKKEYLTTVKCMPTFKGLLLAFSSPETRFERKDEGNNANYINEIIIGEQNIKLSTGINAIIGENGSGKSYILGKINNEDDKRYKGVDLVNAIKISKIGEPSILKISQGDIIAKVKEGNLLDNKSDYYDDILSVDEFKNNIIHFVENLKKYVDERIELREKQRKIEELKLSIKELNEIKNYYLSLNIDIDTYENKPKERYKVINSFYENVNNEFNNNNDFYKGNKEESIKNILRELQSLRKTISDEMNEIDTKNRAINVVVSVFNEVKKKIKNDKTSQENEYEDSIAQIRDFSTKIKNYLTDKQKLTEYPIFPKELNGTSIKSKLGFKFIKEARYNNLNVEPFLYKELFVQNFQTSDKIKDINTKEMFTKAVNGATTYEAIDSKLKSNVQKFLSEYTKEETMIKEENGTNEIGTTPGEIALTFYKLQLSSENDNNVLLIDQPEDDISMKRIENYLIEFFNGVRDKKQVIFVTHNPLLVVNLDVDNVISISKSKRNVINVDAGCLEYGDILEQVSQSLDGGKEAVERRLKIYGTN